MTASSATLLLARLHARARVRHLQLFVKLAELGNLKRSAEALNLSQPAASQLLADLEQLTEAPLFERHARGMRITAAGDALLPAARRALDALADASESLAVIGREGEGVVRVAAITGAIAGLLVRALPAFAREAPGLQILVLESDVDRCLEQVSRREVDLAICREPATLPAGCRFHAHLPDRFVVACGLQHPLAGRRRVSWATLARERWLLPPVRSAARRAFDERMTSLGAQVDSCPVITRVSALTWAMLQGDRLLTLVPWGVVRQLVEAGQLALVDATPALPFAPLGWLMPESGSSRATQHLVDYLERFIRERDRAAD
ncbi:MAG: LysR family transcriptional regulator [Rubrivivax sp.]